MAGPPSLLLLYLCLENFSHLSLAASPPLWALRTLHSQAPPIQMLHPQVPVLLVTVLLTPPLLGPHPKMLLLQATVLLAPALLPPHPKTPPPQSPPPKSAHPSAPVLLVLPLLLPHPKTLPPQAQVLLALPLLLPHQKAPPPQAQPLKTAHPQAPVLLALPLPAPHPTATLLLPHPQAPPPRLTVLAPLLLQTAPTPAMQCLHLVQKRILPTQRPEVLKMKILKHRGPFLIEDRWLLGLLPPPICHLTLDSQWLL
jgi:hypothetical protein